MLSVKLTLLFGLVAITLGCNVPTKHYSTMKCTPINKKGSECPERFDCPSITNHVNSKCYFNGDTYALSEQVPNEKVAPFCSALCYSRLVVHRLHSSAVLTSIVPSSSTGSTTTTAFGRINQTDAARRDRSAERTRRSWPSVPSTVMTFWPASGCIRTRTSV